MMLAASWMPRFESQGIVFVRFLFSPGDAKGPLGWVIMGLPGPVFPSKVRRGCSDWNVQFCKNFRVKLPTDSAEDPFFKTFRI